MGNELRVGAEGRERAQLGSAQAGLHPMQPGHRLSLPAPEGEEGGRETIPKAWSVGERQAAWYQRVDGKANAAP